MYTGSSAWGRCKYIRVALRLDIHVSPNPIHTHQSTQHFYVIYVYPCCPKAKDKERDKTKTVSCSFDLSLCFGTTAEQTMYKVSDKVYGLV